ncbi:Cse1-domain-containing protein [Powellomyces hirtus]|nr:Cse1-domain-containing protein [Powellomyces hirtus]
MEATPEVYAALAHYLGQTLNPATGKEAEQSLAAVEVQQNFPVILLKLVENPSTDQTIRFAGSIYFKNYIKKHWEPSDGETDVISAMDRAAIKAHIVSLMMGVPSTIQTQLGEGVSIMADRDFPHQWEGLIPEILSKISATDHSGNIGLLQIAHSTFKRYRAAVRSTELFMEIKTVIEQFGPAFLTLLQTVDAAIDANASNPSALQPMFQELTLLVRIFYDLNYQDLPEWFEDNQENFMSIFRKYMSYTNPALQTDDAEEPGPIEKLKTAICEVIDLYAKKYEEDFVSLRDFVTIVWHLMTSTGMEPKFDMLVSKSIAFLTTIVQSSRNREMFANPDTLKGVCEKVVLPNMTLRESDEELFEDDPIEYIRRDLEGSDTDTRRRAASDLVRGLLEHFAKEVTDIFSAYVVQKLQTYEKNPAGNWKAKDTALYLMTSLSARSSTAQAGVTKVNEFIEVLPVFTQHILPELQSSADGHSHPIIKVDAIKFLMVFRSQLTKEQLTQVFPSLLNHLVSSNYVVYTYAAVCIERILATKMPNGAMQFHEGDIATVAHPILKHLFDLIEKNGSTPEKLAENDYLMKAAMRIIIVAKHDLEPVAVEMVGRLTKIIEVISPNPSNPKFNHYTFEALAALIRFICARKPALVAEFESLLFPPLLAIITQQIAEFMPYALQILAQLLDFHTEKQIPPAYQSMLNELVMPVLWQANGNVPALIKLLQSYFAKSPMIFIDNKLLSPVLGIVHKLIGSRVNDQFGFDLLCTIFEHVPIEHLTPYLKNVFVILLTRLMQGKTARYTRGFLNFISFLFLLKKEGLTIDIIVGCFDSIQATPLFTNLLRDVLIPELEVMLTPRERKSNVVGLGNLLAQSQIMRTQPYLPLWEPILTGLIRLCETPVAQTKSRTEEEELYTFDIEEVGYQASFSKLTVIGHKEEDMTAGIPDSKCHLAQCVSVATLAEPALRGVISPEIFAKLGEYMSSAAPAPLR